MTLISRFRIVSMLFVITLFGCTKEEPVSADTQEYTYVQTQCADPWDQTGFRDDEATASRVQAYLENQGITVFDVSLRTSEPVAVTCAACHCPSGWYFVVRALESDAAALEALSFSPLPRS